MIEANGLAYFYDHEGRRVQVGEGTSAVHYLWDEFSQFGNVILETNYNYDYSRHYTLANGQILSQTDTLGSLYFLADAQGSTRALTNSTGEITSAYSYDAFGNLPESLSMLDLETHYLYTAQQFDPYTELYSLRARYYDPSVGRFLSRDTWAYNYQNPFELNRYVYTANNPVRYTDPSGHTALFTTAKRTEQSVELYGSPGNPGPGRIFGATVGATLGLAVGYITATFRNQIVMSGACGEAAKQAALANPGFVATASGMAGALIGGLSGYFAPEILALGSTTLNQLGAASALTAIGLSGFELYMTGGDSFVCFLFDVALALLSFGTGTGGFNIPNGDTMLQTGAVLQWALTAVITGNGAINLASACGGDLFVCSSDNSDNNQSHQGRRRTQEPGEWRQKNEAMSDASRDYQAQIAGENRRGWVYDVNGVSFDGYDGERGVLLDAKGLYAQFLDENGQFESWWNGRTTLIDEARRQINAANGVPIEWHVLESDAATAIRSLLRDNNINSITVFNTP